MKKVLLKTFVHPVDAQTTISKLESEGIVCFLDDEHTVTIDPFLSNAVGGVKLKVMEKDGDRALKILVGIEKNDLDRRANEALKTPEGMEKVSKFCPECDSTMVFTSTIPWYIALVQIVLLPIYIILFFQGRKYVCVDCSNQWKE